MPSELHHSRWFLAMLQSTPHQSPKKKKQKQSFPTYSVFLHFFTGVFYKVVWLSVIFSVTSVYKHNHLLYVLKIPHHKVRNKPLFS